MPDELPGQPNVPICVELSGCLLRSDLWSELLLATLRKNILSLFLIPLWLCRGKCFFMQQLVDRAAIEPALLPYSRVLLAYLRHLYACGQRLILIAPVDGPQVRDIARHLEIFQQILVIGLDGHRNSELRLAQLWEKLGDSPFDYAGNSPVQLPIWRRARRRVAVNTGLRTSRILAGTGLSFDRVADLGESQHKLWIRALRLHQWLKNLLVFVPLTVAHRLDEPVLLGQAVVAFVSLGLCASSVYLVNDLLDLGDDRQNPLKCDRPLAAGTLPVSQGLIAIPILLFAAVSIAFLLPVDFRIYLGLYYGIALAYSPILKRIALVDVLVLAILYSIRILAGAAAVAVTPSSWLLAFSLFIFLSLALLKRYTELNSLFTRGLPAPAGRGYLATDMDVLALLGCASGGVSVLVLALYVSSDAVVGLYSNPGILFMLCPLLLYMLMRLWQLALRGDLHGDPIVFLIMDRPGQWLAAIGALLLWLAI